MTFNNILIATDFSEASRSALKQSLLFASKFDATLHILHAVDKLEPGWYGIDDAKQRATALRKAIKQEAHQMLLDLVPDDTGVDVNTHVSMQLSFNVSATILEYAEERNIDLIVIGSRGQTDRGRYSLGRVANEVIEEASCPVLSAAELPPWISRQEPLTDIIAPVDFSDHSHQAYLYARHIAAKFNAELHLAFVAESRTVPFFSDTGLPGLKTLDMPKEMVENSRAALQHMIDHADGPQVEHKIHIKQGQPAPVVLDLIERKGIGLAVIATRGHSVLKRLLLGSTTRRILRMSPCPVMTLRAATANDNA